MDTNDIIGHLLGEWSLTPTRLEAIVLRIALAFLFASSIGYERAINRHFAGLRTFNLVSLASTLAALCDHYLFHTHNSRVPFVSAAAVIGVAIISCNTIMFSSKNQLKELTTSVGLWCTSIISLCIGFGRYTAALIGFAIMMVSLTIFSPIEKRFKRQSPLFKIHLELKNRTLLQEFLDAVRKFGLHIDNVELNPSYATSGMGVYTIAMTVTDRELRRHTRAQLLEALAALSCVHFIEEIQ